MSSADPMETRPSPGEGVEFPAWLWLWGPLGLAILPYAVLAASPAAYERWIRTETGVLESATALFLLLAVLLGVDVLRHRRALPAPWFRRALVLYTLGCLYFFGEEISWGQHYFGWATPEALRLANEQGETNLHNIGGWTEGLLDQGPRALLTLAALAGGVVAPLVLRRRRRAWDPRRDIAPWLWPTLVCLPSSVLALVSNLPRKVAAAFESEVPAFLDIQGGESKECFLALFLLLYLVSIRLRLRAAERG